MCRGGGGNLHYLLSDLQHTATVGTIFLASTPVLRHCLLLQTTCYNHLRLLLHHSSRKGKQKQQQARNPLSRGVEKPEGPSALQPTTEMVIRRDYLAMLFVSECEIN